MVVGSSPTGRAKTVKGFKQLKPFFIFTFAYNLPYKQGSLTSCKASLFIVYLCTKNSVPNVG